MRTLGTAVVCITPQKPVRLCGFGFRTDVYETVRKDIFLKIFTLQEKEERILLIYGDLLWWNPQFVVQMRRELWNCFHIPEDKILFTASHNHSGPGTGDCFIPLLETVDREYVTFLMQQILNGVREAECNKETVVLRRAVGNCALNVYRRVMTELGIAMRPNYHVKPDKRLTIFSFYRENGSLKGRICHYPCHANLSKDNDLHPDYPGYAMELEEKGCPGSTCIFWQGFTADIRPNCVLGDQFRAASANDVMEFASYFHEEVKKAVCNEIAIEEGISLIYKKIPLEVTRIHDEETRIVCEKSPREELRQWAEKVKDKRLSDQEILEMSVLRLGNQICIFMNAEVSMYYADFARKQHKGAICIGYTNGMIGYLSTKIQMEEGGYEPKDSAVYFAVAGVFAPSVQDKLEQEITNC